jgi:RimJ/RimL family protein N-acetyltransferase
MTTTADLRLRNAVSADSALLFAWRNDPRTRAASRHGTLVEPLEHSAWLAGILQDETRQLLVAEVNGTPVGTVRVDRRDGGCELSWNTAPSARGGGIATRMVAQVVASIEGPVWAEIKAQNTASIRVAEGAGLVLERRIGEMLLYARPAAGPTGSRLP